MQVFWEMSKLTRPGTSDADEASTVSPAPLAVDASKQPASGQDDARTVVEPEPEQKPKQESEQKPEQEAEQELSQEQDKENHAHTPSSSPLQFVFNKNTVRKTWRTQIAGGDNHIQFVVERDGFPNGAVICDHVDPDLLFKAVPTLRKRLEGRKIFLPPAAWLDDDTVESLVYDLVQCAKDGTPIPVPDHIMKDPVRMIMMHCVLVFFEMEKQAAEFMEALWGVFASVNLTPLNVLWIWDTFGGNFQSGPYDAPFAHEYVQMMAWRILTLDAKLELDLDIRRLIEFEKEPKYLTEVLETRHRTYGLGRDSAAAKAPAHTTVDPSKPTPTSTTKKASVPGSTSYDSGASNTVDLISSKSQQNTGPTTAAADKYAKAGMKRLNTSGDDDDSRKRFMKGKNESAPAVMSGVRSARAIDATKPPFASPKVPFPAAVSSPRNFGGTDPPQAANKTLNAVKKAAFAGSGIASPSKPSIFGNPTTATSAATSAQPAPPTSATSDGFNLFKPATPVSSQLSGATANTNASSLGEWGAVRPSNATTPSHVQPGSTRNPFVGGLKSVEEQNDALNHSNTFGAISCFPQTAGRGLFGGLAPNAPQADTSNTPFGQPSHGFGASGALPDANNMSGVSSAFSNPQFPTTSTTTFSSSIDTNFGGQPQSASASPFPNAGFGAGNSAGAGNNLFTFQGTPGGNNVSGAVPGAGAKGRIIKKPTGVRRGRR